MTAAADCDEDVFDDVVLSDDELADLIFYFLKSLSEVVSFFFDVCGVCGHDFVMEIIFLGLLGRCCGCLRSIV